METYIFRVKAQDVKQEEKIISGLALPWNIQGSPEHPKFKPGVLIDYGQPKPLLINHDFRNCAGEVLKIWESDDGIRFLANMNTSVDYSAVSVGGEYITDENGNILGLFIYEISLTNNPAYPTNFQFIATNFNKKNKEESFMETRFVKAQEMENLTQEFEILKNRVDQIEEKLAVIETTLANINQQLTELNEKTNTALEGTSKLIDATTVNIQNEMKNYSDALFSQLNATVGVLKEVINAINKK